MCKVLIIDDEEAVRTLLTDVLTINGIDTVAAANGSEGLEKFHRDEFDLVITDMVMPELNGNSVASQIRSSHRPDTPIIGISGTTWLFEEDHFDLVFQKPMSMAAIVDAVRSLAPVKSL